ncbi:GTP-binding protein [Pisolithus sp. B1]|nr:GTP-binding protein [Pisolithus sp. B1]
MAFSRIKKWFKSRPLASGIGSHHNCQTEASDSDPAATEACRAAANPLAGDAPGPVTAQIEAAHQVTKSAEPAYRLSHDTANEYMKNIECFRILVIDRANAGKTTILQRVCNSTDEPEIFDGKGNKIDSATVRGTLKRGFHDIKHELVFQSNPRFVFHDSCGFEAGSTEQFEEMKRFVVDHAAMARKVNNRIHAIWYCIPMTDCHRTVTAAEQKFFNACDTGHVPVMVLLTKSDTLLLDVIQELEDEGFETEESHQKVAQKHGELLEKWLAHIKLELNECKFPPRGYVPLQKMHDDNANCTALIQSTTNVLNEESLQKLLISTQQSSITLST